MKFENYEYSPVLRTRQAELAGYSQLSEDVKNQLLPYFVLGKWPRAVEIERSIQEVLDVIPKGKPFILDVTRLQDHLGEDDGEEITAHDLIDPSGDFKKWIKCIKRIKNEGNFVIPCVQFNKNATRRNIIRQAQLLEDVCHNIAFRINFRQSKQIDAVINAFSALEDPNSCIIYVDLGGITEGNYPAAKAAAVSCINLLRTENPEITIALTGSSFPSSVVPFGESEGIIPILERQLFFEIGGREVALYSDYASISAEIGQPAYRFVPRVDYPMPLSWTYFRERNTEENGNRGYVIAAERLVSSVEFDKYLDCWGKSIIARVASGDLTKMGSPAKWIAVRVNCHITQQCLNPAQDIPEEFSDYEDDDDWAS